MKKRMSILMIAVIIVTLFSGCGKTSSDNETNEKIVANSDESYENLLFDTSYVHSINIDISNDDWSDLLANPLDKTKYQVNVTIDGEEVNNVSFATKGNTSLSSVASDSDSDRYSFKINFGKYVKGQTYHGLNKLNLSNIYADSTYMKDYLSYEIFRKIGVESALTSYIWVKVNGEDYGLYLAVEDISDSYLDRTEDGEGELYKPETEQLDNAGNEGNKDNVDKGNMPDGTTIPDGMTLPDNSLTDSQASDGMGFQRGNKNWTDGNVNAGTDTTAGIADGIANGMKNDINKGFGMSGDDNGASLKYTDDNIESYSDIFDNAETDASDEDMQRVIAALKNLSEGTDLESCLDTDSIIRYFVAHNFVMNYDSYTGNMLHNYYLYEKDGKLSLLPWDYNLSYGTFMNANDATTVVNYGIDTPLSGASEEDRPMWSWITSNKEYLEKYHTYFNELISEFFESGEFESEMNRVYDMILPYVEKDPSAFYNSSEFTQGFNTLKQFCLLRAESIRKQLSGTLSTDTNAQNSTEKIDASSINIQDMGSQNGGKMKNAGQNQQMMPGDQQNGQNQQMMPGDQSNGQNQQMIPGNQQNGQNQTGGAMVQQNTQKL